MSKKSRKNMPMVYQRTINAPMKDVVGTLRDKLKGDLSRIERMVGYPCRLVEIVNPDGSVEIGVVRAELPPPEVVRTQEGDITVLRITGTTVEFRLKEEGTGLMVDANCTDKADIPYLVGLLESAKHQWPESADAIQKVIDRWKQQED